MVTYWLTACTPGSAPGPTLGNRYGKPLASYLPRGATHANYLLMLAIWTFSDYVVEDNRPGLPRISYTWHMPGCSTVFLTAYERDVSIT